MECYYSAKWRLKIIIIIIVGFLINLQVQGLYPQHGGSIAESFHSLRPLSVSCFQVILGLLGPCFPSTCMSKAVLTVPLERSTCPYQRSLLSFSMRPRSSMPSRARNSVDLMVTVSCGLTLQICLIIALSFPCRCLRLGFVNGQVSRAWSIALCTHGKM